MTHGTALHSSSIVKLPPEQRKTILGNLTNEDAAALLYDWPFWARDAQLPPPGDWLTWLVMAGRGFGKTRTGGEWARDAIESGKYGRMAFVAPTAGDVRDVMVEGESGLLAICPPWNMPKYEPSKRRLTWPNGAIATLYSAEEPDRLRGPQHDGAWADELAAWRYPAAWDMLMFGLRLGSDPRVCVTTTPRPTKIIKELMASQQTVVTGGSTYDNRANLAQAFFHNVVSKYEGTRLGRQEIWAQVLSDVPGALWTYDLLEENRRPHVENQIMRCIVAIDPAATATEESSETGIIVAGLSTNGQGYVLADLSLRASPNEWATRAVRAYEEWGADRIVAEVNNGGDMVEATIRTVAPNISYKGVHASRGKLTRAEPIAALYEQHKIHHVGSFPVLEDQLCTWVPGEDSPDHLDALVWAFTELMLGGQQGGWSVY